MTDQIKPEVMECDGHIGIWKRSQDGHGELFERDRERLMEWGHWANVPVIRERSDMRRIVLLGESVARAYFYDPYYTVAGELEAILQVSGCLGDCEVIDLAKTGMDMDQLSDLAMTAITLKPDALVVFAGNNWAPKFQELMRTSYLSEVFERFRCEGLSGVRALAEERFRETVRLFLRQLSDNVRESGIPIVFVIPEFNLGDWRSDEIEQILPWVPDDSIEKWLAAKTQAETARVSGDIRMFEAAAAAMVGADAGNPLGHEWLAEGYLARGLTEKARSCLEKARDTILVRRGDSSNPRCYGVIREAILAEAPELGIFIVDLPEIFRMQLADGLPDRRIFLDYCHLTIEGVKTAMKHTAAKVVEAMTGVGVSADVMPETGIDPGEEVRGVAHFCAAVHNAHYGQNEDIVGYHCRAALPGSSYARIMMRQYIDFATRKTPTVFCRSFEEMVEDGHNRQYEGGLGFPHPRNCKLLDLPLVDGIARLLDADGVQLERIRTLRRAEHAVHGSGDLLASFYRQGSYNDLVMDPRPVFLQVRTTKKRFVFIGSYDGDLSFSIIYRMPGRSAADQVGRVMINGNVAALLPMSPVWRREVFHVPRKCIFEDLNEAVVEWPYTLEPMCGDVPLSSNTLLNTFFPVLGEIFEFAVNSSAE